MSMVRALLALLKQLIRRLNRVPGQVYEMRGKSTRNNDVTLRSLLVPTLRDSPMLSAKMRRLGSVVLEAAEAATRVPRWWSTCCGSEAASAAG